MDLGGKGFFFFFFNLARDTVSWSWMGKQKYAHIYFYSKYNLQAVFLSEGFNTNEHILLQILLIVTCSSA